MNEQLSALMDDEIEVEDALHLIAATQSTKHLSDAWGHYHLIGDAMRGAPVLSSDFKQSLMQKIDLEATVLSPNAALKSVPNSVTTSKNKLPATWSIAASVAAMMVVGWMVVNQETQVDDLSNVEVAQSIPTEYLMAHQATVPSTSSYYIQPVSYAE